jgi:hypothetical protein
VTVSKRVRWSDVACASLAAIALGGTWIAADRAGADTIKREDLLRGITMTRAQCAAIQMTLWLNVYGRDFCVRYHLSTAGGEGPRPVVFLNGDANGPVDVTRDPSGHITLSWHDLSRVRDEDTDNMVRIADSFSKMTKTAAIYIARIGDEGTSGNHLSRKTALELQLTNAALDALKQRHGFEGFHLAGESGGGRVAFGLGALRHDIGCLLSASGQLATPSPPSQTGDPGKTFFQLNVTALAHNHAMRQMVISDPHDQQVPPATDQTPLVVKLRQNGGKVEQFFVQSTDDNHHGLIEYARLVMAGCLLGRSELDIRTAAYTIVRRNALINQGKQEAKAKAAPLAH